MVILRYLFTVGIPGRSFLMPALCAECSFVRQNGLAEFMFPVVIVLIIGVVSIRGTGRFKLVGWVKGVGFCDV